MAQHLTCLPHHANIFSSQYAIIRPVIIPLGKAASQKQAGFGGSWGRSFGIPIGSSLQVVGFASEDSYEFPVTQLDLADTVGLSNVHVNRVLQGMRSEGLIEYESKVLTIRKLDALVEISRFNPNYLHLGKTNEA